LLYEEASSDEQFDEFCEKVAAETIMHTEFLAILKLAAEEKYIGTVVVTCGLKRVWEMVLQREGLSKTVQVIGGGRIADGFVVTAEVKAALVSHMRYVHNIYVWAFGDSVLDLPMLHNADQAVVVVGEQHTRSKTMEGTL
jgi:phosphoserine phosphatase